MIMLYGLLHLSFWGNIVAALLMTHITIICVTVFLHRHQAHRGLDLHPILSHFFRCWLWLTTGMVTKEWVSIHRKHHARCETVDDPHSPQIFGINKVLWQGAELYRSEAKNKETIERFGIGTPDDWIERNLYTRFSKHGIFVMMALDFLLFGVAGLTIWAIQMMWIPFFAAGVINGIGHYWGYRNFECPDASTNILPWGIIIGGEELHNNHHTFGSSAKLSVKWWEFDLGWTYICLFKTLGLAKVRKSIPKPYVDPGKSSIDSDTIKALLTHRFQILARYSHEVILPIFHEEKHKASTMSRSLLNQTKKLLTRADALMDNKAKQILERVLEGKGRLQQVYQHRVQLQAIWAQTTANQREILEALQEWCKQAEATGIDVLRDFADKLKAYSVRSTINNNG